MARPESQDDGDDAQEWRVPKGRAPAAHSRPRGLSAVRQVSDRVAGPVGCAGGLDRAAAEPGRVRDVIGRAPGPGGAARAWQVTRATGVVSAVW